MENNTKNERNLKLLNFLLSIVHVGSHIIPFVLGAIVLGEHHSQSHESHKNIASLALNGIIIIQMFVSGFLLYLDFKPKK